MDKYKLLALDMDGTLLNSNKKISDETARWLTRLSETGVKIALCTGRNIAEIREYDEQLIGVQYAILNSGTILYDTHDFTHPIYTITLDERYVRQALELTRKANGMFHLHTITGSVVDPSDIPRMAEYSMGVYQPMFANVCLHTTDFDSYITDHSYEVLKVCMYHRRPEDRVVSRSILEKEDVQLVYSEKTALEVSPKGTTKELGLRRLCEYLHISPEETVAVGDAENDLEVLGDLQDFPSRWEMPDRKSKKSATWSWETMTTTESSMWFIGFSACNYVCGAYGRGNLLLRFIDSLRGIFP